MESELKPGSTFTHEGVAYVVKAVLGANALCTTPDGKSCLIPLKDVKGN